jgi:hypothetical protein
MAVKYKDKKTLTKKAKKFPEIITTPKKREYKYPHPKIRIIIQ